MAKGTHRAAGGTVSAPPIGMTLGIGLLAGCGIMALISQLGTPDAPASNPKDAALAGAVERMTERFDRLVTQQGEIVRRMTDLELAMLGSPSSSEVMPITSAGTPVELTEIRESMAQVASALESGDALAKGPIVNQVIEAMTMIEERQDAERDAERAERRAQRVDDQLEALTEMLDLDANQQASMRDQLAATSAKRDAIDEIASRNERRDARDDLRTETQAGMAQFLSPAQLQLLEDSGGLDDRGGRGGGGPDFGGGGGRRGR